MSHPIFAPSGPGRAVLFSRAVVLGAVLGIGASSSAAAQESLVAPLRAAAKEKGADASAALALGRALRRAGHLPEAIAELGRGAALAPPASGLQLRVRWELARAQVDRHDLPRAMAACKQLSGLPGAVAEGHACVAHAYLVWQRATEALSETEIALAKDPSCYEAKIAEGRAYELSLEPIQAEAAFRAAAAVVPPAGSGEGRPERIDAHVGLGRVLWRIGRKDEGLAELRLAVQLDPNGPDALYELGIAVAPSAESVSLLERATHERQAFPEAWLALGAQELTGGGVAAARDAAASAVHDDPGSVAALVLQGKVALADGRPDDALAAGRAAMKIVANNAGAVLLVADSYARKGEIDPALEAYQTAWGLDHRDPAPLVHASEACHAAGRDTSARAFGAKAVEEFPNWAPAWAALGDALVGQNERPAARDAYRKALTATDGTIDRAAVQGKLAALR